MSFLDYLKKIIMQNGGEVDFEYINYQTSCDYIKIGIQESASVSSPLGSYPCNKTVKDLYSEVGREDGKLIRLSKITNTINNNEIVFNTSLYGECGRLTKLNSIELKNGNQLIKRVELKY